MPDLWLFVLVGTVILILLGIAACYWLIRWASSSALYHDIGRLPYVDTVLVLGTAKFTQTGGINYYFKYRMEAAELIYRNHKSHYFIVSGAGDRYVDKGEAEDMKMSLIDRGVPEEMIVTDDAGYRTWDSVWRCLHTFHCHEVTVVSQRFHAERAIFIGRRQGLRVVGFISKDVKGKMAFRMFLRECLARVKCIMDCYLIHPEPVFLKKGKR